MGQKNSDGEINVGAGQPPSRSKFDAVAIVACLVAAFSSYWSYRSARQAEDALASAAVATQIELMEEIVSESVSATAKRAKLVWLVALRRDAADFLPEVLFIDAHFEQTRFEELDLNGWHFDNCTFTRCSFDRADLSEARFKWCEFIGHQPDGSGKAASFNGAWLGDAKFDVCRYYPAPNDQRSKNRSKEWPERILNGAWFAFTEPAPTRAGGDLKDYSKSRYEQGTRWPEYHKGAKEGRLDEVGFARLQGLRKGTYEEWLRVFRR